ncbi:MAG: CDP-diacylglycerol diphosphatase [Mycolicibacterium cosmeticum]|nr:CDP-diacylglycerol diphosphatase [Mycolicibacterium cosmeticum]
MTDTTRFRKTFVRFGSRMTMCALSAAAVLALTGTPIANAAQQPFGPPCGDVDSSDYLWQKVKDPKHDKDQVDVVIPNNDRTRGYVVHDGDAEHKSKTDFLLIPTLRISGIECHNLLTDPPNYIKAAADEAEKLMPGKNWALGINSAYARGQNQLHIHITQLDDAAQFNLSTEAGAHNITTDETQWRDSKIFVKNIQFRAWNAKSLDHNFFAHLSDNVVIPLQKQGVQTGMPYQTLVVTKNHMPDGGYIILNSDTESGLKNGTGNIEVLLNKK